MHTMTTHKTVFDDDFQINSSDNEYVYQAELTPILDKLSTPFDQTQ